MGRQGGKSGSRGLERRMGISGRRQVKKMKWLWECERVRGGERVVKSRIVEQARCEVPVGTTKRYASLPCCRWRDATSWWSKQPLSDSPP